MAISLQRLTIYLYSAHRAVIFPIAQLSCMTLQLHLGNWKVKETKLEVCMNTNERMCISAAVVGRYIG